MDAETVATYQVDYAEVFRSRARAVNGTRANL